jgi:pimeloyl-ACP methyl ester carboxylesterase
MSIIALDNDLIHYEVLGRGRPLLFLHGWVGSWRYWIPSMQAISISYRSYAIDLWGFGDSPNRSDRYALSEQVKLLNAFIAEMGIGRVALVGHGLGALVGLLFNQIYPEIVDRIIVTAVPLEKAMVNPRLRMDTMESLMEWLLGKTPDADAARLEAPKADPEAVRKSLDSIDQINWMSLIMEMQVPCLFIQGALDPVVDPLPVELFSHLPENKHQVLLESSGHFPMLDEPGKYNRLLAEFLSLPSGESIRGIQLRDEWKRRIR